MLPAAQVEQTADPALLYMLSAPQNTHAALPAALFCPAGQLWGLLSPLHENPAMHLVHPVLVVDPPPVVYDPAGHFLQLSRPSASEYWSSCPQLTQDPTPPGLYFPRGHLSKVEDPLHA